MGPSTIPGSVGFDLEQERVNQAPAGEPSGQPDDSAEGHHHKEVRRDTANHVTGTSAQREANADLMAPLNE